MQIGNSRVQWGFVSKTFHWIIVVLIIVQYTLAQVAEDLPLGLQKFTTLARHKSIGLTILGLAILRLLWRWANPTPELPGTLKPWEKKLATTTHFAMYLLLFAMPVTGWLMSSAANFPVSWFGVFTLPDLLAPDRGLQETLHDVHETLFKFLVTLAVLHVAAALKHHFWLKDDVLRRMVPFMSVSRDNSSRGDR